MEVSQNEYQYHDYNTGAKLDKDKVLAVQRSLYQDPQAGTSVDGTVILYVFHCNSKFKSDQAPSSTTFVIGKHWQYNFKHWNLDRSYSHRADSLNN